MRTVRSNTLILSTILLATTAGAASENSYRSEINISGSTSKYGSKQFSEAVKINEVIVSGTYYFSEVATNNHPLAEAVFLERSSSVSIAYSRERFRNENTRIGEVLNNQPVSITDGLTNRTTTFGAADIDFYIPNSIFYLGGSLSEGSVKTRLRYNLGEELIEWSDSEDTGTLWTLRAGIIPIDGLLVWSAFSKDQELDDEWNINAKYVMDWSGNALNLQASYDYFYGTDNLALAADFYFDRTFSLGATYSYSDYTELSDFYGLRLRKFFTDKFAVETNFITSDAGDSYLVGATLRF